MLRTFSGKKPDRPAPPPEELVGITVHVHAVRYASLHTHAWVVLELAGEARTLGPATSEADAFGDGYCVFDAAATFKGPRDSAVDVTVVSGDGAREDAVTVGAVRVSASDGRDAWRPLDAEGAVRCAACVAGDDAVDGDPARLGAEADAAREPAQCANASRPGVAVRDLAWAGFGCDARAGAYAAAARTLEPHATVDPAAAALEPLLKKI